MQLWRRRDDSRAGLFDWYAAEIVSQVRPAVASTEDSLPAASGVTARFEARDTSDSRPTVDVALTVAHNPTTFGVSFPGLALVRIDPVFKTARDRREIHRAHEVAHQWWGASVEFANYHDQWLSEGFASFAALWYVQVALRSNRAYLDALDRMSEEIAGNRRWILGSGQEAGPIWLGYRTSTSVTPGDYDLIVYEKGPGCCTCCAP